MMKQFVIVTILIITLSTCISPQKDPENAWQAIQHVRTIMATKGHRQALVIAVDYWHNVDRSDPNRMAMTNLLFELCASLADPETALVIAKQCKDKQLQLSSIANNLLLKTLFDGALTLLTEEQGDWSRVENYLVKAHELSPPSTEFTGTYLDRHAIEVYLDLARYLDSPSLPQEPVVTLQFLAMAIEGLKLYFTAPDGTITNYDQKLNQKIIGQYTSQFRLVSRLLAMFSQGRIQATSSIETIPGTITRMGQHSYQNYAPGSAQNVRSFALPDLHSIIPVLADSYWPRRNDADVYVWIYPMGNLPYIAVHGTPRFEYAPGGPHSPLRYQLHLHEKAAVRHIALLHEFFHAIEYTFNPARTAS